MFQAPVSTTMPVPLVSSCTSSASSLVARIPSSSRSSSLRQYRVLPVCVGRWGFRKEYGRK